MTGASTSLVSSNSGAASTTDGNGDNRRAGDRRYPGCGRRGESRVRQLRDRRRGRRGRPGHQLERLPPELAGGRALHPDQPVDRRRQRRQSRPHAQGQRRRKPRLLLIRRRQPRGREQLLRRPPARRRRRHDRARLGRQRVRDRGRHLRQRQHDRLGRAAVASLRTATRMPSVSSPERSREGRCGSPRGRRAASPS